MLREKESDNKGNIQTDLSSLSRRMKRSWQQTVITMRTPRKPLHAFTIRKNMRNAHIINTPRYVPWTMYRVPCTKFARWRAKLRSRSKANFWINAVLCSGRFWISWAVFQPWWCEKMRNAHIINTWYISHGTRYIGPWYMKGSMKGFMNKCIPNAFVLGFRPGQTH